MAWCQMLDEMGMAAFAERAHRDLRATGDKAAPRTIQSSQVTRPWTGTRPWRTRTAERHSQELS